jgi:TPR repeat protein
MVCGACGQESAKEFSFCPHCGKQRYAKMLCHACGKESEEIFKFCPHCGSATLPVTAVIEPQSPPPEVMPALEAATEESPPTLIVGANGTNRIGTYVFGAFSVIALLVSLIKGIVPIYLLESAIWAGAAWYWHRKKTHSELAKAVVIVLAALIAIGEVIQIARQFDTPKEATASRAADPFDKYAVPPGNSASLTSPSSDDASAASAVSPVSSGEASPSLGGTKAAPPTALSTRHERASDVKTHDIRGHVRDQLREAHRLDDLKRYDEAAPLYQKACDAGEMDGCANLGVMYTRGLGVAQDYEHGRKLTQLACGAGNMDGCTGLGRLYQTGKGVPLDNAQARSVYEKVCDSGKMIGCFDLGTLYLVGQGGAQDYAKAFMLFQEACNGGEMSGCTGLGHLYQYGNGVSQDVVRARGLFEKACDSGESMGCTNLGRMYESGEWVTRNVPRAISFYKRACGGGEQSACRSLSSLH